MERTAEGRSELAEQADDSASSAYATIPSSPRGARSITERGLFLYASNAEAVEQLEHEIQDSRKDKRVHTRNDTDSGDAEERRETKQSAARPRQSAERPPRSTGHAEHDSTRPKEKKSTGRLNEGKISAKARK